MRQTKRLRQWKVGHRRWDVIVFAWSGVWMGGHVVLVVQNSLLHEQLIDGLAADGYCALCFHSIEEAVVYLREAGCPAFVVVFDVTMRRQSDFATVAELSLQRPELH